MNKWEKNINVRFGKSGKSGGDLAVGFGVKSIEIGFFSPHIVKEIADA